MHKNARVLLCIHLRGSPRIHYVCMYSILSLCMYVIYVPAATPTCPPGGASGSSLSTLPRSRWDSPPEPQSLQVVAVIVVAAAVAVDLVVV